MSALGWFLGGALTVHALNAFAEWRRTRRAEVGRARWMPLPEEGE